MGKLNKSEGGQLSGGAGGNLGGSHAGLVGGAADSGGENINPQKMAETEAERKKAAKKAAAEAKKIAEAEVATAEKEAERHAQAVDLLRVGADYLERMGNLKAPINSKNHPYNVHRPDFMVGLRVALRVLGREDDNGNVVASLEEVHDALGVVSHKFGLAHGGGYSHFKGRIEDWIQQFKSL